MALLEEECTGSDHGWYTAKIVLRQIYLFEYVCSGHDALYSVCMAEQPQLSIHAC